MANEKERCYECSGHKTLSKCCGFEADLTLSGSYQCQMCYKFCKVYDCYNCDDDGYEIDDEE